MSQEELQTLSAPQFGLKSVWTDRVQHAFHAVTASLPVLAAPLHAQSVFRWDSAAPSQGSSAGLQAA